MTRNTIRRPAARGTLVLGLLVAAGGLALVAVGFGWIAHDASEANAPPWVIAAAGVVFVCGGIAIIAQPYPRVLAAIVCVLCLAMAAVAAWATFLADPASIQGGIPLAPRAVNVALARGLSGFGILLALFMARAAFREAIGASSIARRPSHHEPAAGNDD